MRWAPPELTGLRPASTGFKAGSRTSEREPSFPKLGVSMPYIKLPVRPSKVWTHLFPLNLWKLAVVTDTV